MEQATVRNVQETCVYDTYILPKLYAKMQYRVSCEIHSLVVRVCSCIDRRSVTHRSVLEAGMICQSLVKPLVLLEELMFTLD